MSKKNKFFFKLAIFFILLGGLCCLVALLGGSNFEQLTRLLNSSSVLNYFYRNNNEDLDSDSKIWDIDSQNNASTIQLTENFSTLSIKLDKLPITIYSSDSNYVQFKDISKEKVSVKNKNGTLTISDSDFSFNPLNGLNRESYNERGMIELYLTQQNLKKLSINLVSGSVFSSDCNIFTQELDIQNDYGIIRLENINSNQTKVKNDSGEIFMTGTLNNKSTITTQNGKVVLNLQNDKAQCSFYGFEQGLGSILVNGSIPSQDKVSSQKAPNSFDLKCSLGTISISTN